MALPERQTGKGKTFSPSQIEVTGDLYTWRLKLEKYDVHESGLGAAEHLEMGSCNFFFCLRYPPLDIFNALYGVDKKVGFRFLSKDITKTTA